MSDWISVDERLPEIGEWVQVYQNKAAYSEMLNEEDPAYWYPDAYYGAKLWKRWITKVTPAQVRYVDSEGFASWEQNQLASGRAVEDIEFVTHWKYLSEPPLK